VPDGVPIAGRPLRSSAVIKPPADRALSRAEKKQKNARKLFIRAAPLQRLSTALPPPPANGASAGCSRRSKSSEYAIALSSFRRHSLLSEERKNRQIVARASNCFFAASVALISCGAAVARTTPTQSLTLRVLKSRSRSHSANAVRVQAPSFSRRAAKEGQDDV
jgi:hypothetical protein